MHMGFHVLPPYLKKKEKSKGFPIYIQFPVIFQGPLKFVISSHINSPVNIQLVLLQVIVIFFLYFYNSHFVLLLG